MYLIVNDWSVWIFSVQLISCEAVWHIQHRWRYMCTVCCYLLFHFLCILFSIPTVSEIHLLTILSHLELQLQLQLQLALQPTRRARVLKQSARYHTQRNGGLFVRLSVQGDDATKWIHTADANGLFLLLLLFLFLYFCVCHGDECDRWRGPLICQRPIL